MELKRPTRRVSAAFLSAAFAATLVYAAAPAVADAPSDGCASGFTAHTLQEWAAMGYSGAPPAVDSTANGGNGDGIVCGRELGVGTEHLTNGTKVLYEFADNNLPASR